MQEVSRTDETQLQEQLQQQLALRGEREQALKHAREELEGAEQTLRTTEQERLASEHKLAPARERINELRLKEQEARLAEESFASQLAEAQANEEELLPLLEEGVRASKLQAEINRLNEDMAALGAVNRTEAVLKKLGKNYSFHRYDGAGHAFFNASRVAYRAEQAADGWSKVFDFFHKHLG
jgi:chromosome segregation protein